MREEFVPSLHWAASFGAAVAAAVLSRRVWTLQHTGSARAALAVPCWCAVGALIVAAPVCSSATAIASGHGAHEIAWIAAFEVARSGLLGALVLRLTATGSGTLLATVAAGILVPAISGLVPALASARVLLQTSLGATGPVAGTASWRAVTADIAAGAAVACAALALRPKSKR